MDSAIRIIVETLKELLRTGLIAIIPVVIDGLSAGSVDWRLAGTAGLIAVLRAFDKMLHEYGKSTNTKIQGLVGF